MAQSLFLGVSQPISLANPDVSFERQYHFVDPTDRHHRRKARSHVVNERLRELRLCGSDTGRNTSKQLKTSTCCSNSSNGMAKVSTKKRQFGQRIKLRTIISAKDISKKDHMSCFVSFSGLDPFQVLPIDPSSEVQLLVDHYLKVIPTLLPMPLQTSSQQYQPAVDLFRLYSLDRASFLGMLYHSARHRESLLCDGTSESLSLAFKVKTIQEVNIQIENAKLQGQCPENGTIMAIYLLSAGERMWGDVNIFRMHWRAMYDIMDAKGGAEAFADDNLMYAKAVWNCFALLNARDGYFNCAQIARTVGGDYDFRIPSESMIRHCHYFVQSYIERKASIIHLLPNTETESLVQGDIYSRRLTAFRSGRVLHQILNPCYNADSAKQSHTCVPEPTNPNRSIPMLGDRSRTDNCRLACIIYLNLVLMELGDFSKHTEAFLSSLEGVFLAIRRCYLQSTSFGSYFVRQRLQFRGNPNIFG